MAAIAADQQVSVYILVNKCDLDAGEKLAEIYRHAGFPVIQTSAETGQGIEELRSLLTGKLTAFTGNSGVGKSSILNRLCPELTLATGRSPRNWAVGGTPPAMWSCILWETILLWRIRRDFPLLARTRWTLS